MNRILTILRGFCLLICLFSSTVNAQEPSIDMVLTDISLEEAIAQLEQDHHFLFSYKEEDVKSIKVTIDVKNADIQTVLNTLLKGGNLEFEIINDNYVILSIKETDDQKRSADEKTSIPQSILCGTIVDSFTQKQLPFASVYIKGGRSGSYALEDGSFRFKAALNNEDTLVVSYVGYEEKQYRAENFIAGDCPVIALSYLDFGDNFIVVTDYLTDGIDLGEQGAATVIRPQRTPVMPGQAEADVLSNIQFLPGIASPDGAASDIYIRGGTPDQNLILWEDIPIYHSAHYFGMISAFNPYIIDQVKVYRGGFGADYGGRISGVIDMKSHDYRLKESAFGAGANFIHSYTYGKVALLDNKASITYSLRRSLSELWRSPTFKNITNRNQQNLLLLGNVSLSSLPPNIKTTEAFNFFDGHVKTSLKLSSRDELSLAGFYGDNNFDNVVKDINKRQDQEDILDLQNRGLSLSWSRQWQENLQTKLVGVSTQYNYDYRYDVTSTDGNSSDRFGVKENNIDEQQIHFSSSYTTKEKHQLKAGYQFINYDVAYQIVKETEMSEREGKRDDFTSKLQAVYLDFNSASEKTFGINAGLRFSHYEKTDQLYLEPRLNAWYNFSEDLSFHASGGRYYQFLSQLVEFKGDDIGIITPIWVLAGDDAIPVLGATQFQLGMVYNKNSWVIDLQFYSKNIDGLTSLATGFTLRPKGYDLGTSQVKGLDLLIKKRWKNFRSWMSYSLSKADYTFETFFDSDFAAPYDQRHVLSWVNMLEAGPFEFSMGWKIASGKPFSRIDRFEIVKDGMGPDFARPIYRAYNNENLPLCHQLDISVQYNFYPKSKGKWKGTAGLSLFNVYSSENIYNREFYVDLRRDRAPRIERTDKQSLGFTPNLVFRIEW